MAKTKLTMAGAKAIYTAAKNGYSQSYAMMLQDAFEPATQAAKKYAIEEPLYDAGWFPMMYGFIRNHRSWDSLHDDTKATILLAMKGE